MRAAIEEGEKTLQRKKAIPMKNFAASLFAASLTFRYGCEIAPVSIAPANQTYCYE